MAYLGDITIFAGNFEPYGWFFCDGRVLPISEYSALFNLVGTSYGGDGIVVFGIPDLRSRVPVHQGTGSTGFGYVLGLRGGAESVALSTQEIPAHSHAFYASSEASTASTPDDSVLGNSPSLQMYRDATPNTQLSTGSLTGAGGSQPHENRQLTATVNYIICVIDGAFPTP
jgi:microcystin-dependent protein